MQTRPGRAPRGCPDAQRRRCCRRHRPSRLPMMFYTAAVNGAFAFFCRRAAAHGSRCHAGISAEPAVLYHHHPGDLPDPDPHDVHERKQNGGGWQSKWSVPFCPACVRGPVRRGTAAGKKASAAALPGCLGPCAERCGYFLCLCFYRAVPSGARMVILPSTAASSISCSRKYSIRIS